MSVSRLAYITRIGVEQMGDLADSLKDPNVLRLENLDTDLRPPQSALEFTKRAVDDDDANSYLPFFGLDVMRQAAVNLVGRQAGQEYDWKTECVISAGGLSGILTVRPRSRSSTPGAPVAHLAKASSDIRGNAASRIERSTEKSGRSLLC